jgi:two-component system cell cycle response regulator DivK
MASLLIVDDNEKNLRLLRDILEASNYQVMTANSGRDALQSLEQGSFDLILLDIQMPEMSGTEVFQILRERKITTPVIAVTALAMKGDEDALLEAGFNAYVSKPIAFKELLSKVASFVSPP